MKLRPVYLHRLPIEAENCPNRLAGNRHPEAFRLLKEAEVSGHGIMSLGATIEYLFGLNGCVTFR
jgi:hypothetical protein